MKRTAAIATCFGLVLATAGPVAPAGAQTATTISVIDSEAQLSAQAFDGLGPTLPPPDEDGDTDFQNFTGNVQSTDASSEEPGRNANATAFQDTKMLGDEFRGVDTTGRADAETNDTDDEGRPSAQATSDLAVDLQVSGGSATYRVIGTIKATSSATNNECSFVQTRLSDLFVFRVESQSCGSTDTPQRLSFDQTGLVPPGAYSFLTTAHARSQADNGQDARAAVDFDVRLTFEGCTIVVPTAGAVTIGTPEADVICGTEGGDDIRGRDGRDTIYGFGGVDSLEGEGDADAIFGGDGGDIAVGGGDGDFFIGEDGVDSFTGGPGIDLASGGPQRDLLFMGGGEGSIALGDGGDDIIEGGAGVDDFNGGPGTDTLRGLGGRDFLNGADDADCLVGGAARDDYKGGDANDTLLAREGTRDTGTGGPGPDRGRFDAVDTIASVANRNFQGGC